jgi:transglutaminase-like putative cysteine protease
MALNVKESMVTRAVMGASVLVLLGLGLYTAFDTNAMRGASSQTSFREVEVCYIFTVEDIDPAAKNILAWVPLPLDNSRQQLKAWEIEGSTPYRIVEEKEYGNKFILFDLSESDGKSRGNVSVRIKFEVLRYATSPLKHPQEYPGLDDLEKDRYLKPVRFIPIDGKIAEEAQQVTAQSRDSLHSSRLLYDHIVRTMQYDKSQKGWGRGDAVYACNIRQGNCTDFHSLYIGEARSLGIPARFIMGFPLPDNKSQGMIDGYHCWAEFFIKDKGWLPIDASEASKFPDKKENIFTYAVLSGIARRNSDGFF